MNAEDREIDAVVREIMARVGNVRRDGPVRVEDVVFAIMPGITFIGRKKMKKQMGPRLYPMKKEAEEERVCIVCLENVVKGEEVYRIPCKHTHFHCKCLDEWAKHNSCTCPLCHKPY